MTIETKAGSAETLAQKRLGWRPIDESDVDLWVPVGGEGTAAFNVLPGTYRFHCKIPGHAAAGMEGRLVATP